MKRNWLFVRLLRPQWMNHDDHTTQAMSAVVPELVGYLRSTDPGGRWSFQRLNDQQGLNLGLWFHSTSEVLDTVESRLRAQCAELDWPVSTELYPAQSGKYLSMQCAELAKDLSWASSDLALDVLREGPVRTDDQLSLVVMHLSRLVDLVAAPDQPSFLFFYWQHWTNSMQPGRRIELGIQADQRSAQILADATALRMSDTLERSWQRYLLLTREITFDRTPAEVEMPVNYLLFDHAHLTHNRLGIPDSVEALAARVLRSALISGTPLPGPRVLQSA